MATDREDAFLCLPSSHTELTEQRQSTAQHQPAPSGDDGPVPVRTGQDDDRQLDEHERDEQPDHNRKAPTTLGM